MVNSYQLNRQGDLVYLTAPNLTGSGVVHAFSTRQGGVSPAPYNSLNLGLHVGDNPDNVITNRQRLCAALGSDLSRLVAAQQVHGDKVVTVDASFAGKGSRTWENALPETDALVTSEPGVLLSTYYADCVPLAFWDPVGRVVALAHAGWKGTVLRIGAETVRHMVEKHGSRPENILAAVGQSIGPCCYEVDEPVIKRVRECLADCPDPARPGRPGRWWLNLQEANRQVLLQAGIKPENISMAGYCTACREDLFFSHRGQNGRTGRTAALIMLTGG